MITRKFELRYFTLLFAFLFSLGLNAQDELLPTKEQVDAKNARLSSQNWETPVGKINPNNTIMVTGTEQNCSNGIPVCTQSYTQSTSYTGFGTVQEVIGTCLSGKETNSVWYIFTAQTTGLFGFTLVTAKDYDFALYDITTMGCAGIPTATPVRCNFSATFGNTGMSTAGAGTSIPSTGIPWCTELAVTAGSTYALIIDNWSADATGYTINFTSGAGYSSITDVTAPTINPPNSVVNNCNGTFTLNFSEPVKCSTIAANGSDFTLTGGGVITGAVGVGCSSGQSLTTQVTITYTVPGSGTYTLGVAVGSDGNTILDKCNNAMSTAQTITLNSLHALTLTASPSTICTPGTSVTLSVTGAPNSTANIYTLSPGGVAASSDGSGNATYTVTPSATTTYVVSATYAGCTGTATATVTLTNNVVVSINPINPTICSGSTTLTASTTVNGVACPTCTFQWSGASTATTNTITATAGTYSVTTSTTAGCTGNTAASTVTLASAGGGSTCNIYFVNTAYGAPVAGVSDCLTKTTPGSLVTALSLATCNNAIIYMQAGTYSFTDRMSVNGFVTIEGGFSSNFTIKTSDLRASGAGGTGTIITRSNTADSDDITACSAFKVAASASNFRFQDLRIEMPGNASGTVAVHLASTGRSNYGIKLGAGCTSYKIVRCYIDAGAGSAP